MKTSDAIPSSVEEGRKEWAREVMSSQELVSHGKETRKVSGTIPCDNAKKTP